MARAPGCPGLLAVPAGSDPIAREGVGPAHHRGTEAVPLGARVSCSWVLCAHSPVGLLPPCREGWALPKHSPVPRGCPQLPSPARVPRGECVPARYAQPCSDLMSPVGSSGAGGVLGDWQRCGSARRDHCLPHHPWAPLLPLRVTPLRVGSTAPRGGGADTAG